MRLANNSVRRRGVSVQNMRKVSEDERRTHKAYIEALDSVRKCDLIQFINLPLHKLWRARYLEFNFTIIIIKCHLNRT